MAIKYHIYAHISDIYDNMTVPIGVICSILLFDIISVTHQTFMHCTIYITHYNFYILCDICDGLLL